MKKVSLSHVNRYTNSIEIQRKNLKSYKIRKISYRQRHNSLVNTALLQLRAGYDYLKDTQNFRLTDFYDGHTITA